MLTYRCDNCGITFNTKGGSHRVFYKWLKPDGTEDYGFDRIPVGASLVHPAPNIYEGNDPRIMQIQFGPYDRDIANTQEQWAGVLKCLNELGAQRLFQMACRHDNATQIAGEA